MSKEKDKPAPSDRHKPSRMVRIRKRLADQADILAARLAMDFTEVANLAFRELLERHNLWPPPEER